MSEATQVYETTASGLWNSRHEIKDESGLLGVMNIRRGGLLVRGGDYRPEKGEVYLFRRDPGILRSQFSMWTDTKEWLGSSLRWSFLRREVALHTGGRPFRMLPLPGFRRGWSLYAPKTGETARISVPMVGRGARIEVYRRLDFPLLLFSYFLGAQLYPESLLPGPTAERAMQQTDRSLL